MKLHNFTIAVLLGALSPSLALADQSLNFDMAAPEGQEKEASTSEKKAESSDVKGDAEPLKKKIEVSFGNSELFSGGLDEVIAGDLGSYVPARSALFLLERLFNERWSAVVAINMPLTAQPILVDGVLTQHSIAPSYLMGARWSPFVYEIETRAVFELQLATLLGRTFGSEEGDIFFPLVGVRTHISRPDGFAMYLGVMSSLRRETLALIYGVGNRF